MTKSYATVEEAFRLRDDGLNLSRISRATGVTRSTQLVARAPGDAYAYLLGQYLGDGYICAMGPRGVFRLRVSTCDDYPNIRDECAAAMRKVAPNNVVGFVQSVGCSEVCAYSKHWPCLFPQHGAGKKHERLIKLEPWQVPDRPEVLGPPPRPNVRGVAKKKSKLRTLFKWIRRISMVAAVASAVRKVITEQNEANKPPAV